MKRIACVAILVFVGMMGTAQAQVAATGLVPAAPNFMGGSVAGLNGANITPDNPAAVAWSNPSRVAAGAIRGNNYVPPKYDFSGEFYGARVVGHTLGLAVEQSKVSDDSGSNLGTLDQSNDVQLSFDVNDTLAVGVGSGKIKSDTAAADMKRTEAGAAFRLNEVWYFGLAAYRDKDTYSGNTYSRNGTLAGVAVRTQGQWHWYLAYDYIDLDNFKISGISTGGFSTSRYTIQLAAGNIVLGASNANINDKSTGSTHDWTSTTYDLGYAPMKGFTVSGRQQTTKATNGSTQKITTNSLAVGWQF